MKQNTRYFKTINRLNELNSFIWKLKPDGSWYINYFSKENNRWSRSDGPWSIRNLEDIYNHAARHKCKFIEISEEDFFLELI